MRNVTVSIEDNELIVRVDLTKTLGFTGNQKNALIAASGTITLPGENCTLRSERMNISVWRPLSPAEKARGEIVISEDKLAESERERVF